jgi:hypothetical protein
MAMSICAAFNEGASLTPSPVIATISPFAFSVGSRGISLHDWSSIHSRSNGGNPVSADQVERRPAAIFAADVDGYSRLMGIHDVGTLRTLTAHRAVMDGLIARHLGRIFNTAGDSVLGTEVNHGWSALDQA